MSTSFQSDSVAYVSWHIWNIAADAAKRATDLKAANPRACSADTVSTIIVAAAATESFINEIAHKLSNLDAGGGFILQTTPVDWKGIGESLGQLEDKRERVTTKYFLASKLLPKDALQKDAPSYQDFKRLIGIRNAFVHPKPQIPKDLDYDYFVNKGWTYNAKTDKVKLDGWMSQLETPDIARWACRSAHSIIWDIVERFDGTSEYLIQRLHEDLKFQWGKTVNDPRILSGVIK